MIVVLERPCCRFLWESAGSKTPPRSNERAFACIRTEPDMFCLTFERMQSRSYCNRCALMYHDTLQVFCRSSTTLIKASARFGLRFGRNVNQASAQRELARRCDLARSELNYYIVLLRSTVARATTTSSTERLSCRSRASHQRVINGGQCAHVRASFRCYECVPAWRCVSGECAVTSLEAAERRPRNSTLCRNVFRLCLCDC